MISNSKSFCVQVYSVDLRNHGESPNHPSHTHEDIAADVFLFLKEHDIPKVTIAGHSLGGRYAALTVFKQVKEKFRWQMIAK